MNRPSHVILTLCALALAGPASAQTPPVDPARAAVGREAADEAAAALAECARAARARDRDLALAAAGRAESLFREAARREPANPAPRVGLARVLTQCRIGFANPMSAGRLLGESNRLLEEALTLDPSHWEARYSLAMNHANSPGFLNRTGNAIRELETLLGQQGDRSDAAHLALPYVALGDLYLRTRRRDDAIGIWRRGLALFPDHAGLMRRLDEAGEALAAGPPLAADGGPTQDAAAPGAATGAAEAAPGAAEAAPPPTVHTLAPLVIETGGYRVDDARPGAALSRMDVYTTPGGTADVFQVFQTVPGVTRATEGSDLYVRGGDPAETPVFVDGARMIYAGAFETVHGGIFGVLDPSVLRRAYFSSGGFSARYGNALSGVLDVETEGRPAASSWRVGANLVSGGATLRAPLGPAAGAWGSVRAAHNGVLMRVHGRGGEFPVSPRSLEATLGAFLEPADGLELRVTALAETDEFGRALELAGHDGVFRGTGDTRLVAVSARRIGGGGRSALRATAYATDRNAGFEFGVLERQRTDRGHGLRLDLDVARSAAARLRFGAEAARPSASETGREPVTDRLAADAPWRALPGTREAASHLGAYAEAELFGAGGLGVVAGARADRLPGEEAWTADPRLALAYRVSPDWVIRAGGGVFHQGRWRSRYRLPGAGSPGGDPRRARHLTAGVESAGSPSLRLEAYLKRYDRYVHDGDGGPPTVAGMAAGADAIGRWTAGERLSGWIAYSYLRSRVELETGETLPAAADVPHTLTAVSRLSVGRLSEVGLTARYGSGRPHTPMLGLETGPDGVIPVHGPAHSERLPDYARLDARVTRLVPLPAGMGVVYLEMLNLLDRPNVLGYTYDAGYDSRRPIRSFFADRTFVLGFELQF